MRYLLQLSHSIGHKVSVMSLSVDAVGVELSWSSGFCLGGSRPDTLSHTTHLVSPLTLMCYPYRPLTWRAGSIRDFGNRAACGMSQPPQPQWAQEVYIRIDLYLLSSRKHRSSHLLHVPYTGCPATSNCKFSVFSFTGNSVKIWSKPVYW